jgi:hypothetical protein
MAPIISKDPVQKHIEIISLTIWLLLCIAGYVLLDTHFASGVLVGGAVCMINYQWLYRHAKAAITLTARQGKSFMARRYFIRLAATGAVLYLLIAIMKVNIIGLLLGLSVVILGIMSYACFTYIFAGGD